MTILINFLGCASSGKTSLSAKLFARLKELDLIVEFPSEYVKTWAWDGRKVGLFDQFYIFGKEVHQQSRLFDKVDYIISDSPVMLTAFYQYYYYGTGALDDACRNFYKMVENQGVKVLNFFLPRKKKYVAKGRYQTEQEADEVARMLQEWLDKEGYEYKYLDCKDSERLDVVISELVKLENAKDRQEKVEEVA